jgi:hypothetical protein
LVPIQSPIQWTKGFFPEVKWPRRNVDQSLLYAAEVRNEWRYTSAPPVCLDGVDRDNFSPYVTAE